MSTGNTTNGLAGMHDIEFSQYNEDCLQIKLVHPFLNCRKEQLVAASEEAGLKWVENPTNSHTHFIRRLLEKDPTLRQGLYHMHSSLNWTRTQALHRKGTLY